LKFIALQDVYELM